MSTKQNSISPSTPEVYPYLRWSSAAQTEGDSERRQLTAAQQWCASRGLKLSDRTYKDQGVSARVGANMTDGALGELVKIAKPNDVLLIEDQDRFSRANPIAALLSLQSVVNKGIRVVFMRSGSEVNCANFNDMATIVPTFFGALLANQENEKRAFRVKQSWEKRYAELRSGKTTRMPLPGWLTRDAGGKVILDEAKAATVRRIFKLALEGWGRKRIAQTFNAEGVPTITGHAHWNGFSIQACVIQNRAAIGEYEMKQDKRPTGEVLKGIYPPVVSEQTFYAVQSQSERKAERSAPARAASACLVTGLVHCPSCGGRMSHHTNRHTKTGKIYKYLLCTANKSGNAPSAACSKRVDYTTFEGALLGLLAQSDKVQAAMGQRNSEPGRIAELRGKVASLDKLAEKYLRAFETEDGGTKAMRRANELEQQAETLRAELQAEERKQAAVTPPQTAFARFQAELAAHAHESAYREQVKTCLRDMIAAVRFQSSEAFDVAFKDGQTLTVNMGKGAFYADK